MKVATFVTACLIICTATCASAQTISRTRPIVLAANPVTSASPATSSRPRTLVRPASAERSPTYGRVITAQYEYESSEPADAPPQLPFDSEARPAPLPGAFASPPAQALQPIPSSAGVRYADYQAAPCACPQVARTVYAPISPAPSVVTFRPLVPITPMPASYYVGRGLVGQPKLYVPGQPIRNVLRYLSP